MPDSQPQVAPFSRAEGKKRSRQKLLTATINSIAKRGFAETTLARVAEGAGLSRGIVNFHFRTKDQLFLETLKAMSNEYREYWTRAFDEAGPTAAEKLEAVLMVDFEPPLANRNRLACWFAFYGEAKSRPTYMAACTETDHVNFLAVIDICQTLIDEGGYEHLKAELVAEGLSAMGEGLWLDLLISPHSLDVEKARATLKNYLRALFPKHFPIRKCPDSG